MTEQELDALIEENLNLAFIYFDKVSEEGSVKDNGDTTRILNLIKKEEHQ